MSADSSDSTEVEQSQPATGATEAATTPPRQRILIGSQRPGAADAEARAKPVTPGAPLQVQPTAAATADAAGSTDSPAAPTPPVAPKQPAAKKPRQHYPPPNIRDRLTPELEAEYMAALGDLSFDALMTEGATGDTFDELAPESRVTGRVAKIHGDDVFIELSGRNQGVVPFRQFEDYEPKPGEEIELIVVRFDPDEGLYELARPTAAVDVGNWDEVREGQIIEVNVTGANKGGLECQVAGIRGFIPMGQVSIYRVENPEEFVGQRLACVVTEVNRDRGNLVLSHRAVMERERNELRKNLWRNWPPASFARELFAASRILASSLIWVVWTASSTSASLVGTA